MIKCPHCKGRVVRQYPDEPFTCINCSREMEETAVISQLQNVTVP